MKADPEFDFPALVRWLNAAGVRFVVIGGQAVCLYGSDRITQDYDVWFDPGARERVLRHLEDDLDFDVSAAPEDRSKGIVVCRAGKDKLDAFFPRGLSNREQVHLDFEEVFRRAIVQDDPDDPALYLRIPDIDDLIALKKARPVPNANDVHDIEFLTVLKDSTERR